MSMIQWSWMTQQYRVEVSLEEQHSRELTDHEIEHKIWGCGHDRNNDTSVLKNKAES